MPSPVAFTLDLSAMTSVCYIADRDLLVPLNNISNEMIPLEAELSLPTLANVCRLFISIEFVSNSKG